MSTSDMLALGPTQQVSPWILVCLPSVQHPWLCLTIKMAHDDLPNSCGKNAVLYVVCGLFVADDFRQRVVWGLT